VNVVRIRIHHPLFAGFLGVVVLLSLLVVGLVGSGLRHEMTSRYRDGLQRELGLASELVRVSPDSDPDSLAGAIAELIGHRVSLILPSGRVIGDSDVPEELLPTLESHASRPEVTAALAGATGFGERESATVGVRLLYGARLLVAGDRRIVIRIAASLDEMDRAVVRTRRTVVFAGFLGGVAALLVAYLLSLMLARPLVQLSEHASALAEGDFSRRIRGEQRVVEMRELASAFNLLSDELQTRLSELGHERDEMQALIDCMAEGVVALTQDARIVRVNRAARELLELEKPVLPAPVGTVVRQPTLLRIFEESVSRGMDAQEIELGDRHLIVSARTLDSGGSVVTLFDVTAIRRLERVRQDFVANASHEIKTPLTAIRGFAETLIDDEPPDDIRKQFLGLIQGNTIRLQRLVDDLLDLSRLESGGWKANCEPVHVAEVAEDAWRGCLIAASEGPQPLQKRVEFRTVGDAVAWADPSALEQIFRNLLSNSLRHVRDKGWIDARISLTHDHVVVEVVDNGSGIPEADLPRVFERFYRADAARSRAEGGTGLGLAIVRHLVTTMGGTVEAESRPGSGTMIRFTLPLDRREDEPAQHFRQAEEA
jgi:two-component system, OmpR family, phosphate regulon sensor histidine kinase PhoR